MHYAMLAAHQRGHRMTCCMIENLTGPRVLRTARQNVLIERYRDDEAEGGQSCSTAR